MSDAYGCSNNRIQNSVSDRPPERPVTERISEHGTLKPETFVPEKLVQEKVDLTSRQKDIINGLQGGFPLCERPFDELAKRFECEPREVQQTIQVLLDSGVLSRFGPLFNIEALGGCFSLCALMVPEQRFEDVAGLVNSYDEVAHNYARDHAWNMWFVLAASSREALNSVFEEILDRTDCPGMNLPKEREFFVGLYFDV